MSKRVIFTFDERALAALEKFKSDGGYKTMAAAVRDALQIAIALQSQASQGYTEVVVKNARGQGRVLIIPGR